MGICGFYQETWIPGESFPSSWRVTRRRAHIAIDVLSFAIGAQPINKEVLSLRLIASLRDISNLFKIERAAIFLDGRATHNLKSAEQARRLNHRDERAVAQLRYVKECTWSSHVVDRLSAFLKIDEKFVTVNRNDGEADVQIFSHFDQWGIVNHEVDNVVISSDSDVLFMSTFAPQISWFIRRNPGKPPIRYKTTGVSDRVKTRMMKYAILNKTDFYSLLYGGRYIDPSPDAAWDCSDIASLAHSVIAFLRDVLTTKKPTKRAIVSATETANVVSIIARRIWFLRTCAHFPTNIDEDATLVSKCEKKTVTSVLVTVDVETLVESILKIVSNKSNAEYTNSIH